MAALQGVHRSTKQALSAATALTMLQIVAPTNQRGKVLKISISFDGTNSANTPALVRICRQTGGTFTNSTVAPTKLNDPTGTGETLQFTSNNTATVEPTTTDILEEYLEPVFGGLVVIQWTPGQEPLIPGGTKLGVILNAPQAVNATVTVVVEE